MTRAAITPDFTLAYFSCHSTTCTSVNCKKMKGLVKHADKCKIRAKKVDATSVNASGLFTKFTLGL